jgi:hypothetical protein
MIDDIDSPYSSIPSLKAAIYARGLDDGNTDELRPKVVSSGQGSAFLLKHEMERKKGEA